jgi:hypothetical protein
MNYIYYVNGKKIRTKDFYKIPLNKISSPDENTPALENLKKGQKIWCKINRKYHRLTGPADIGHDKSDIGRDKSEYFYLNGKEYEDVKDWLKAHPNPDLYFDTLGMNETDRVLWFLQN